MRIKFAGVVFVAGLGFAISAATACPDEKSTAKKGQSVTVAADKAKGGCGKSAATLVAKLDDGRSEAAVKTKKGGCNKPCAGKSATAGAEKFDGCGPGCKCGKGAKTVADKAAQPPCQGHGAKTTADKTAQPPCHGAKKTADKGKGGCDKPCHGKGTTTASSEGCPKSKKISAVLASMPTMKYRVNGDVLGCSKRAEAIAKETGKPIEYVVGEEVLSGWGEANARLIALLEKETETLQSMQFVAGGKCHRCPVTAKDVAKKAGSTVAYRVGGVDFEKKEDAEKALVSIREGLASIRMEYKVDGKTYGCSKTAGAKCKKNGKKMSYVIGDEETDCEKTAQLMLTEAKVRKIVETAVATSFSL